MFLLPTNKIKGQCRVHNGVGKLDFSGRRLIPDRSGDVIDHTLLIRLIDDLSRKSSFVG